VPPAFHPRQTVHGSTSPSQSWRDAQPSDGQAVRPVNFASADEGAEDEFAEDGDAVATDAQVPALTEVEGVATDLGVPRYRPHVSDRRSLQMRSAPGQIARDHVLWRDRCVRHLPHAGSLSG
jgi:hypothetical protein